MYMHLNPKIERQPTSCSARVMVRTLFLKHKTSLRKHKNIGHVMTILSVGACLFVRLRALVRVRGAWLLRRLLPRRDRGLCPSLLPLPRARMRLIARAPHRAPPHKQACGNTRIVGIAAVAGAGQPGPPNMVSSCREESELHLEQ